VLPIIELTEADPQFADCLAIRMVVFVQEQNVPADEEHDDYDAVARHFLVLGDAGPLATARVILQEDGLVAKIGRVAVLRPARGNGLGLALMQHIETVLRSGASQPEVIRLDAQIHALRFYETLGYEAYGAEFLDAGIPHRHMAKRLN